ncbi:MAG: tetratricopeptide repeat protein, partial [Bacteroidota bacterium]
GYDLGFNKMVELGAAVGRLGEHDQALKLFDQVISLNPNLAEAYYNRGIARGQKGDLEGAIKDYDEAIRLLERAYKATPEHLFLEQLADIHRATGQFQPADSVIKKILDTFEQDEQRGWNINREYAMLCANHEHNLPEALERAKTEYDRRPNNIDVLDTYAWALYKNGKASEAVPFVERAMRLNTESSALHYRAGMIYYAAGQREKGFAYLKRSLNENPFVHVLYVNSARKMISSLRNPPLTNK